MSYGVYIKCVTKGQALKIAEYVLRGTFDEHVSVSVIEQEEWVLKDTGEKSDWDTNIQHFVKKSNTEAVKCLD